MADIAGGVRRYGVMLVFLLLVLASCGPATVRPTATPAPSRTPVPPTAAPAPSSTARPSATPTAPPSATPTVFPTVTPLPTPAYGRMPTLAPTVNPTALPHLVRAALTVREEEGVAGHPLRRVTGWEYGIGGWVGWGCAYRWLDDEHLLLSAFAGEEDLMGIEPWTLPVVVNLSSSAVWLPQAQRSLWCCDYPVWSAALQALITVRQGDVLFLDPEGQVVQRYPDAGGFDIAPSGRWLLIGSVWRDLETGRTVDTGAPLQPAWAAAVAAGASERAADGAPPGRWAWSSDETRLFSCCFYYVDVDNLELSGPVSLGYLEPVGRGVPGCGGGRISSSWVLDDRFVVLNWDFFTTEEWDMEKRVTGPFVDPLAQTYTSLCALAGVPPDKPCGGWDKAPDSNHFLLQSEGRLYVVGADAVTIYPLPRRSNGNVLWSPDSRVALFQWNADQTGPGEYWLFSIERGRFDQVTVTTILTPTWSPHGERLAFFQDGQTLSVVDPPTMAVRSKALSQSFTQILWQPQARALVIYAEGARTLALVDLESWTATPISLSRPLVQVLWQPEGAGLVVQADDGSLWWLPGQAAGQVEPLTPPLPAVRDLQWSPDGRSLSLVSGADVYVVSIDE